MTEKFSRLFATVFYLGYSPLFPGTITSFFTLILLYFLPEISVIYSSLILTILFFLGVWSSAQVAIFEKEHDPSIVVIDEVVGMWLSLLIVPKIWWLYGVAFLLFRFFDIVKIYPINKAEKLDKGWGIMLDDVIAGLFSFCLVHFIKFWFIKG